MKRYATKKWWTMTESDSGGYVSYDEANEMIDQLKIEKYRLRVDNDNVWQRVAQQSNEYSELENRYKILQKMFWDLDTMYKQELLQSNSISHWCFAGWLGCFVCLFAIIFILTGA